MADSTNVQAEDLVPVGSRISWGPILAGATLALALYSLLTLLGGAIGLSVSGSVRSDNLMTGAAVWAILTTALSLFAGGYVTSQLTVGENKSEALLYGVIMWAVMFAMLLWLMASGVRGGFNAVVGLAYAGGAVAKDTTAQDWETAARQAGVSQEQIDEWRRKAKDAPESARRAAEDPANQQAAAEAVTKASWWAFGGTLLSMIAAAAGALAGSGPTFRLVPVGYAHTRRRAA
jgi:hypothetical protein